MCFTITGFSISSASFLRKGKGNLQSQLAVCILPLTSATLNHKLMLKQIKSWVKGCSPTYSLFVFEVRRLSDASISLFIFLIPWSFVLDTAVVVPYSEKFLNFRILWMLAPYSKTRTAKTWIAHGQLLGVQGANNVSVQVLCRGFETEWPSGPIPMDCYRHQLALPR